MQSVGHRMIYSAKKNELLILVPMCLLQKKNTNKLKNKTNKKKVKSVSGSCGMITFCYLCENINYKRFEGDAGQCLPRETTSLCISIYT